MCVTRLTERVFLPPYSSTATVLACTFTMRYGLGVGRSSLLFVVLARASASGLDVVTKGGLSRKI